ncbi:MAG: histidinol-phosphate transaminase [Candidatus Dadabacteria bacterium]|nr:histidinol-phosphate transaminase [Candidatus Dadabacteria bacterium]
MSDAGSIKSRISKSVRSISAYSVPRIDCSVKLDGNESPYDLEGEEKLALSERLAKLPVNRYPDPEALDVRTSLSRAVGFSVDGILLGNGSDEIIQMIVEVLGGKSGRVLVPSPTFSMYRITSLLLGKQVTEVELDESFDIDLEQTLETIRAQDPDIVFLATPNNPTGNSFSEEKVLEILEASGGAVVVDEAYCDFSKKSYIPHIDKYENLLVLRTMSKIGFAGARLGALFARPQIADEVNKARLPYNINSLSQQVMSFALENPEVIERKISLILSERERVRASLERIEEIYVYPTDANFFLVRVPDADFLFTELVKNDILVRRFEGRGRLANCLRITVGTSDENDRLTEALVSIFSS